MSVNVQYSLFEPNDELSLLRQEVRALRFQIEYMEKENRRQFHSIGKMLLDLRRERKKEKKDAMSSS